MNLEFKITVELGDDVAFAPGADAKFFSKELTCFATKLMAFYSASELATPQVSVSVPDLPEWPVQPKLTIV